ncbi:glycosyltransferase [Nocardioides rubriscoriae]|uniref:glycosyltransferase n=1 Tax=Nocardioides rubriscoriae TaxID=642762 RepID=UPI0011E069F1|nr:glycosyltransferase [Nocardioides rubriscoriae]
MASDPTDTVEVVHVVVPAHDEAQLLPAALDSLTAALEHVRDATAGVTARLTVVLDACTDDSAQVCAGRDVDVVVTAAGNVGAARAAGTTRAAALAAADAVAPAATWIACTDGDSRVPVDWLTDQLAVARAGADVVLGRVEPDDTAAAAVVAAWHALHDDGRVGVHGAHLGFRLSAYDAAGGWAHLADREDLDLYRRLLATGARYGAATRPVLTSSRLQGRVSGGFAAFLATLDRPAP